jgi:PIN domain nuclease of toxin-antitoxin system
MDRLLLDTCALLWLVNGERMSADSREAVRQAARRDAVFLSPISAWEIAMLSARSQIALTYDPEDWFTRALRMRGFRLAELSVGVLTASVFLPGNPPRDPADRILLSTCRKEGMRIVTRDRALLNYASSGFVAALSC